MKNTKKRLNFDAFQELVRLGYVLRNDNGEIDSCVSRYEWINSSVKEDGAVKTGLPELFPYFYNCSGELVKRK